MVMLKILLTIDSLDASKGGPSQNVPRLGQALTASKLAEGVLFSLSHGLTLPTGSSPDVLACSSLERLLRRSHELRAYLATQSERVIVHDNGLWSPSNILFGRVARQFGLPLVISPRGMLHPTALQFKRWKKCLAWHTYQSRLLKVASGFHVTSHDEYEHIRNLGFKQPIAIVPNGIDVPELARVWGSSKHPSVVLYLGRIHEYKGVIELLHAWKRCSRDDWLMRFAGPIEPAFRDEFLALVQALGLTKTVELHPPVSAAKKWDMLREASVLVLPSRSENFGTVVAEALAVGVPVIASSGTPWSELVPRMCGWWIAPEPSTLATTLSEAMSLPTGELESMGHRGRNWMLSSFAWPSLVQRLLSFYGTL